MAKRVVTYLSDEQYELLKEKMNELHIDDAVMLRWALHCYWFHVLQRTDWPDNDPERGGKREGAGRPPKQGGAED